MKLVKNGVRNGNEFDHSGITCLRYEIKDIQPPENVVAAMHQQVSAERKKRAEILESEGIQLY
jgi:regulator of protease activity HflC (stomatin/prohibitin superfamily)